MAKRPKTRAAGTPAERAPRLLPHAAEREPVSRPPSFSFHYADTGGSPPCCVAPNVDADEVLRFMCTISTTTWAELRAMQTGGKGKRHRKHHEIPIESLASDAQDDLVKRKLDEVVGDDVFRFRLDGTSRLWGFVVDGIFHVLWWDPEHQICPSEKSHT